MYNYLFITFSFFLGAAMTYGASPYLGVVVSACVTGLFGSFFAKKELQAAVYTGSFAGMSSTYIVSDIWELLIVALAGGGLLVILERKFVGHGGKLGATAFLSVTALVLLKGLLWSS